MIRKKHKTSTKLCKMITKRQKTTQKKTHRNTKQPQKEIQNGQTKLFQCHKKMQKRGQTTFCSVSVSLSVRHTLCETHSSLWDTLLSVRHTPLCETHSSMWDTLLSVRHTPLCETHSSLCPDSPNVSLAGLLLFLTPLFLSKFLSASLSFVSLNMVPSLCAICLPLLSPVTPRMLFVKDGDDHRGPLSIWPGRALHLPLTVWSIIHKCFLLCCGSRLLARGSVCLSLSAPLVITATLPLLGVSQHVLHFHCATFFLSRLWNCSQPQRPCPVWCCDTGALWLGKGRSLRRLNLLSWNSHYQLLNDLHPTRYKSQRRYLAVLKYAGFKSKPHGLFLDAYFGCFLSIRLAPLLDPSQQQI